jgi:hypothetical protein
MSKKTYKTPNNASMIAAEPAVAYRNVDAETASSGDSWNPNRPFHGTQEEWWDHFHRIEEGEFDPISEVHQRILQRIDK